jgi:NTE family protein
MLRKAALALPDVLPCPADKTLALAEVPTRLKRLDQVVQQRLVNWGYAVCDAAMRKHLLTTAAAPNALPYVAAGIG